MSKAAKRLGRGLDSLVSDLRTDPPPSPGTTRTGLRKSEPPAVGSSAADNSGPNDAHLTVPIDQLKPNPFQPRSEPAGSEIDQLAASVAQHGLLQPIAVRRQGGRFQIIAGERRWRAARKAGLSEVPVTIREADDEQMLELALVENLQREDLNAIDRAKGYRQFCREFGLSAEGVAERIGEDRTTVTNYIRLLDLEPELQDMVASGALSMGHARCLLGVAGGARRVELAKSVVSRGLPVRAVEDLVRREKAGRVGSGGTRALRHQSPHMKDVESKFERAVKTKVMIVEGRRKGQGKIILEYYSLDDFDRIASLLGVDMD